MVVDTSALIAILLEEPECNTFIGLIADADDALISAGTLAEASIVMHAKTGGAGIGDLDDLLAAAGVRCVAVDLAQARIAREAYARYGNGLAAAALNYGDCFAYALARVTGSPLLFKGADFERTDVSTVSY